MTATTSTAGGYVAAPNKVLRAANGIDYAYREVGERTPPLVLLQHFRGNLDNWDPALIDAMASARRVVTFDNAGVGGSTGTTPSTFRQMATRRDRVPRCDGARRRRRPRVLHRQLRRPGDRAPASGTRPPTGPRVLGAQGGDGDARLGPRGHPRHRRLRLPTQMATSACSSRARRQAGKQGWRPWSG